MQVKSKVISVLLAAAVFAGGAALAAETRPAPGAAAGAQGGSRTDMQGMMQGGTMGGEGARSGEDMMQGGMMNMMDMMNMMGACGRMMNGGSSSMPRLPAGNEKLELEMQAEMMQKMGEILASYAAKLPDSQRSAR